MFAHTFLRFAGLLLPRQFEEPEHSSGRGPKPECLGTLGTKATGNENNLQNQSRGACPKMEISGGTHTHTLGLCKYQNSLCVRVCVLKQSVGGRSGPPTVFHWSKMISGHCFEKRLSLEKLVAGSATKMVRTDSLSFLLWEQALEKVRKNMTKMSPSFTQLRMII